MLTAAAARDLVRRPHGMDPDQATAFLDLLMAGTLPAAEGGDLLVALAERGETPDELAALVTGLLARAAPAPVAPRCVDVCGTGGSGLTRFNVSTTAAFILAAAGIPVAKHGNRGSQRANGSFDLLDQLGVAYALPAPALARLLAETGVCFLFARAVHPAVAAVAPYRKAAGRRTVFNLAGPLANPCRPVRQVVGVTNAATARVVAGALERLGSERACVVWGEPGLDEFSVTGTSTWLQVGGGPARSGTLPALHHGLCHEELPGGEAVENAAIFRRLLAGDERGPLRDMVALNAGVAIDLWHDRAPDLGGPGYRQALALLESGAVQQRFAQHVDLARTLGAAVAKPA